jgi:hypothetical protein
MAAISLSRNEEVVAVILGNPVMIQAYQAGVPANGKPVPDGAKMAKVHWNAKQNECFPDATVPGELMNVDFMVKDSKRFADSGGWGYAVFDYNATCRTSNEQITIYGGVGLAFQDAVAAWQIWAGGECGRRGIPGDRLARIVGMSRSGRPNTT